MLSVEAVQLNETEFVVVPVAVSDVGAVGGVLSGVPQMSFTHCGLSIKGFRFP